MCARHLWWGTSRPSGLRYTCLCLHSSCTVAIWACCHVVIAWLELTARLGIQAQPTVRAAGGPLPTTATFLEVRPQETRATGTQPLAPLEAAGPGCAGRVESAGLVAFGDLSACTILQCSPCLPITTGCPSLAVPRHPGHGSARGQQWTPALSSGMRAGFPHGAPGVLHTPGAGVLFCYM